MRRIALPLIFLAAPVSAGEPLIFGQRFTTPLFSPPGWYGPWSGVCTGHRRNIRVGITMDSAAGRPSTPASPVAATVSGQAISASPARRGVSGPTG